MSRHRQARKADAARTVQETAVFTVPSDVPDDRVQFHAGKYMTKFGEWLERQGYCVHQMSKPVVDLTPIPIEPDRRRYRICALVSRRPRQFIWTVPDAAVEELLKLGRVRLRD